MSSDQEKLSAEALGAAFPEASGVLERYVEILATRGMEWGLLGPREGDKLWSRHVSNSLALVDLLPHGVDVADIGSGAGLPGIPLAIVRPDLRITLIESLLRRVNFLEMVVEELGLGERVDVVRGRAEEHKAGFDVVTARAVAPLEKLLKWTTPLFLPHGELLALKGETAEEEIRDAGKLVQKLKLSAQVLEVRADPAVAGTRVIRVNKAIQ